MKSLEKLNQIVGIGIAFSKDKMKKNRDIENEKREDREITAKKLDVDESNLEFYSIWEYDEQRLYLWNVIDPKSELFHSTVSGRIWIN